MTDEAKKTNTTNEKPSSSGNRDNKNNSRERDGRNRRGRGGRGRGDKPQEEFDSTIVDLARVTRVMAGGKRMSFRACVVIGDKKGRVGMGVKKGADVQLAVQKATDYAKKHLVQVKINEGTLPHTTVARFKGAQVLMKPAKEGTGIIAGGPIRVVMEMAGIQNVVAKMQGSSNKVNNVTAVIRSLKDMKSAQDIQQRKG